jgi:PilZ domain-containing protein
MSDSEQRGTERVTLTIPIRVIGIDANGAQFSEDTTTSVINRAGARVILKHQVIPDDVVRIINLESLSEADFRVVGPTRPGGTDSNELGVECMEKDHNIWGIELPPPLTGDADAGALLECRGCKQQAFWALTLMEIEVLNSTGQVLRQCSKCGKTVYWTYADTIRRPREFAPSGSVTPPVRPDIAMKNVEKRVDKRLGMKMPIRVRTEKGETEVSKTENVSKHGFGANLGLELQVGEIVHVVCPYTPGAAQNIEQKAEVRRRPSQSFGGQRLYGFLYIR